MENSDQATMANNGQERPQEEVELMARVVAGDEAAFGEFIERHRTVALAVASRHGADPEDVVQEASLAAWRARDRYDAERSAPRSWYLMIVRNRAIDSFRNRARRPLAANEGEAVLELELETGPGPEETALAQETRQHLRRAVAALPEQQREAIELAYFRDLSHGEMAEALGTPLGTVKGRCRGALTRLRRDAILAAEREPVAA